jgi:hypothetical protein
MASSDEYRRLAQECIALAERATEPLDRVRLLAMAQAWRELADKEDMRGPTPR